MDKPTRQCWIILGAAVALVAVIVLGVYLPQHRKLGRLRTQRGTLQKALEADQAKAAVVPELLRSLEAMKGRYERFDRRLPRNKELGGFLAEIASHLSAANLADPSIEPRNPTAEELYHTLPIGMRCRGSYLELGRFLQRISQMERLTRVHSLSIRKDVKDKKLNVDMRLNIYFTES